MRDRGGKNDSIVEEGSVTTVVAIYLVRPRTIRIVVRLLPSDGICTCAVRRCASEWNACIGGMGRWVCPFV